ncbi:mechanosensitive channel MscK [Kineobactrum sediminis]|nr:mechanosensitive channel MscK [Kineobactrum sediminis]
MSGFSLRLLGFLLLGHLAFTAVAQTETTAITSVQSELRLLGESGLPEAERQQLQTLYQATLDFLLDTQRLETEQAELRKQLAEAPGRISSLRQRVEELQLPAAEALRSRFAELELPEVEELLRDKLAQLFVWQGQLTNINSELIAAQTLPERSQARIANNQAREQALSEQLRQAQKQPESRSNRARIEQLRAERANLAALNDLLQQRLAGNRLLQDLAQQQRDLLRRQIRAMELEIDVLQEVLDNRRRTQSEQAISATREQQLSANTHTILLTEVSLNRQLSEQLLASTVRIGEITRRNITLAQQVDNLIQVDRALEQQIAVLEGSILLSRILQQQKATLPRVRLQADIADEIADLRLRQFELNALQTERSDPDDYVSMLLVELPEHARAEQFKPLQRIVNDSTRLIEQLLDITSSQLSQAITLQMRQRQLQDLTDNLKQVINNQLIWVASARRIDLPWLLELPENVYRQWQSLPLATGLELLLRSLANNWGWLLALSGILALYARARPALRRLLAALNEDVRDFHRDSATHTLKALLLTVAIIAPVPLLIAAFALLLFTLEPPLPIAGYVLLQVALAWFVLHLFYRVLDNDGIACRHFHWPEPMVQQLHKLISRIAPILLPLVLTIAVNLSVPEYLGQDVIGRVLILVGMLLLGALFYRTMRSSKHLYESRTRYLGAMLALVLTPLVLAGMAFWGYQYTAMNVANRYLYTLYLMVGWLLAEGTVVRSLSVAARKLAYQRALTKREPETNEDTPEPGADLETREVNQQSLRLARLGIFVLFAVLIYLVWSDLVGAAAYLDSISLWQYNAGTSESPQLAPMTVADVLGALLIVVFTITLARNLPGLLEIMVLSRLNLQQGSSFAMTTMLSYVIVSVGIISTLSALGVSWNKLQWLVAALSVGLGFGLQEIFANAVSGVIILFERPVRIGDVITVGDLSGTVSQIRIRATTITDFDRKEIIIPNKTFVTGQLINWSLSDTLIRLVISVGVAYGSDLEKTRELLLQIARDHPDVLKEPEPTVLFLSFGDSSLNHELRIFVGDLNTRLTVLDEVNRQVDTLFKENNIEIAFRQVDLNLRSSEGLDQLVARLPAK